MILPPASIVGTVETEADRYKATRRRPCAIHLDPNINTAIELQATRLRAVRALRSSSNPSSQPVTPAWTNSQPSRITTKVTLALAAVVPIVLAWALAAR